MIIRPTARRNPLPREHAARSRCQGPCCSFLSRRASESAHDNGVEIKIYRIIYDCINDIKKLIEGMLTPETVEVKLGTAECRKVFKISNVGTIAGCYVPSGKIVRGANVRVIRDGIIKAEDKISSLQKDKSKGVKSYGL